MQIAARLDMNSGKKRDTKLEHETERRRTTHNCIADASDGYSSFSIFHFSRVFHPSFEAISLRSNPCVKNGKTFKTKLKPLQSDCVVCENLQKGKSAHFGSGHCGRHFRSVS